VRFVGSELIYVYLLQGRRNILIVISTLIVDDVRTKYPFYLQEVTSHMLPKAMAHEDVPKPHRKVSRLKTIGHQIRYNHCYCCFMIHLPYSVPHNLPWKNELRGRGRDWCRRWT
jgi:hypothetical protein